MCPRRFLLSLSVPHFRRLWHILLRILLDPKATGVGEATVQDSTTGLGHRSGYCVEIGLYVGSGSFTRSDAPLGVPWIPGDV